nr:hypothetical protein [Kineosporia corallincola]
MAAGVAETVEEYAPVPAEFFAATWNVYALPFVSPVTVAASVVDVPSANVDQELTLLRRYWTM